MELIAILLVILYIYFFLKIFKIYKLKQKIATGGCILLLFSTISFFLTWLIVSTFQPENFLYGFPSLIGILVSISLIIIAQLIKLKKLFLKKYNQFENEKTARLFAFIFLSLFIITGVLFIIIGSSLKIYRYPVSPYLGKHYLDSINDIFTGLGITIIISGSMITNINKKR